MNLLNESFSCEGVTGGLRLDLKMISSFGRGNLGITIRHVHFEIFSAVFDQPK